MNELKEYILTHKRAVLIGTAGLAILGTIAALICTVFIKAPQGAEPVPEGRIYDAGVFGDDVTIYDSTQGEILIEGSATSVALGDTDSIKLISDPDQIWLEDVYAGNHTPIEAIEIEDGSLGILTVDKLGLSVNVFESPDQMEAMTKGVAHFPSTSAWDGNVGLSAHTINFDGSDGFFKDLHLLAEGDVIRYQTTLGERTYTVSAVREIDKDDWSSLGYSDENQLTLITCISGKPEKRLCVQAME